MGYVVWEVRRHDVLGVGGLSVLDQVGGFVFFFGVLCFLVEIRGLVELVFPTEDDLQGMTEPLLVDENFVFQVSVENFRFWNEEEQRDGAFKINVAVVLVGNVLERRGKVLRSNFLSYEWRKAVEVVRVEVVVEWTNGVEKIVVVVRQVITENTQYYFKRIAVKSLWQVALSTCFTSLQARKAL